MELIQFVAERPLGALAVVFLAFGLTWLVGQIWERLWVGTKANKPVAVLAFLAALWLFAQAATWLLG